MSVRRPSTMTAACTTAVMTALVLLSAGPAGATTVSQGHDLVQVSAVAIAPCPVTKVEQRSAAARNEAKAAQAAAKQAQAAARAAAARTVAAGSRKGSAQEQAARRAVAVADKEAQRAVQAARLAEVVAQRTAKAGAKAVRARSKPHCTTAS